MLPPASSSERAEIDPRFLYVRLLSLRPLLMESTKGQKQSAPINALPEAELGSLDNEVIKRCCTLCIDTASRLVDTIYSNLDTLYRSSGWHSVYCESTSPYFTIQSYALFS